MDQFRECLSNGTAVERGFVPLASPVPPSGSSLQMVVSVARSCLIRRERRALQKRRGEARSPLHSLYHAAMNARRTLLRVVTAAALAALAPARAFAADALPVPAPGPPSPPVMPPPTVTVDPTTAPPVATTPPPPPEAAPSAADLALKRVLRSSCRDGLDDVRAAGGDPNTPWAATVARLCDDIVLEKKYTVTGGNEGRGRLVLWSSLYGIWLGIATDIMFEIDGDRAVIVAPLVGLGAGLGLSLAATSNTQLTVGEAWTIITGLDYGTSTARCGRAAST